jgi:hypothetical protein
MDGYQTLLAQLAATQTADFAAFATEEAAREEGLRRAQREAPWLFQESVANAYTKAYLLKDVKRMDELRKQMSDRDRALIKRWASESDDLKGIPEG